MLKRRSLIIKKESVAGTSLPRPDPLAGVVVIPVDPVDDRRRVDVESSGPDLMADYAEFKARLEIDRDRIDAAVMEQSALFEEVGERHVKACDLRDGAKERLAITDSKIAAKHRAALSAAKEKSTDSIITDLVMLDPDRYADNVIYQRRKYEADMWGTLRSAYEHRVKMLRELTTLYASSYFTAQSMGGPRNTVRDALADTARTKLDEDRRARRGS